MGKVYSKAFASIEDVEGKDYGPHGGFTAVLSTPSEDRDGDELYAEEWKDFTFDRYPLDMDHGMTVADTIGSFVPYFDGQKMLMDANFAATPKAQEVRSLVMPDENGIRHIQTVSVAFMIDKTKKSGEPRRELLNAGIVAIPSNRDAVILASKAASALKDAFSDSIEGDVPAEVKTAVLEALGVKALEEELTEVEIRSAETGEPVEDLDDAKTGDLVEPVEKKTGTIYVDVVPRFDEKAWQGIVDKLAESGLKATSTASGVGGDGSLIQAIHDASSHLGAGCPVIEVTDPNTGASEGANKGLKYVDPKSAIAGIDAILDEAVELSGSADRESLPEPVAQALDLLVGARDATGCLMRELGIFDPDAPKSVTAHEAFEKALDQVLTPEDSPADEAAAASVEEPAPADDAADEKAKRMRDLQLMQMRTKLTHS